MNHLLFAIQGFLFINFQGAGCVKLMSSKEKISKAQLFFFDLSWLNNFSLRTIQIIGLCELLCSTTIFISLIFRIQTILTPIAASGIFLIMVLAIIVHMKERDYKNIVINFVWLLMAAFVAYEKFRQVTTII